MSHKYKILLIVCLFVIGIGSLLFKLNQNINNKTLSLNATVLNINDKIVTFSDENNKTYSFKNNNYKLEIGDLVSLSYTGILDDNMDIQDCIINDYKILSVELESPTTNIIFKDYLDLAKRKIEKMTNNEIIGQILLVNYPSSDSISFLKEYPVAGFIFFEKDFKNKNTEQVINMIKNAQKASKIPLLTAVDEEGGSVIRVSSNSKLIDKPFASAKDLYQEGGFDKIKEDTIAKSKFLYRLGLNLNLAPVVDISLDEKDYIYPRTIGLDAEKTSTYAKTVILASKNTGVSYTLKHFPGYGNNQNTHTQSSKDTRSLESIMKNDIKPFEEGIKNGAESVLVSHNIVTSIDENNPSSLSLKVHSLLKNDLGFTGIIITDSLDMEAVANIPNHITKAILAGNDLLIVSDYQKAFEEIKNALENNTLSLDLLKEHATLVLAWKYYKGLITDSEK